MHIKQGLRGALLMAGALVLLWGPTAGAQGKADPGKAKARQLFRQANKLYERGLYLDALTKYREARRLYPSYKIDLNIGGTLDALGRRTEAAVYFERFLLSSRGAPQKIIEVAEGRLAQLKAKLGSLRISALEERAAVEVDGVVVGRTPLELPVYFEPGKHQLRVVKEGFEVYSKQVTIKAGEHGKLAVLLKRKGEAPSAGEAGDGDKAAPAAALSAEDQRLRKVYRRMTLTGYIGLGAGAAFTVAAAVLYGVGGAQGSSAYDEYQSYESPADAPLIADAYKDVESAQTKLIVANILAGVAAVGFGVAIYQFLFRPDLEERAEPATAVGFTPAPGGGFVSLGGTF